MTAALQIRSAASSRAWASRKRRAVVLAAIADSERHTAKRVALTLSTVPPSVNNMFANKRTGGRVKSAEYKAWRAMAVAELRTIQRAPLIRGKVRIRLAIERPNASSDLSNRLKAIEDALVEANVIEDDRLIEGYDRFEWAPIQGVEIEVRAA